MNENEIEEITKSKEIGEMAKDIECAKGSIETWHCRDTNCEKCEYKNCQNSAIAEELIEQGYRQCKDKIVLTKEEYEKLKDDNKYLREMIDKFRKDNTNIRKETAREICKDIRLFLPNDTLKVITRYFKEILGVEVDK